MHPEPTQLRPNFSLRNKMPKKVTFCHSVIFGDTLILLCIWRALFFLRSSRCIWWPACKRLVCSSWHSRHPSSPPRTETSDLTLHTPADHQSHSVRRVHISQSVLTEWRKAPVCLDLSTSMKVRVFIDCQNDNNNWVTVMSFRQGKPLLNFCCVIK